MVVDLYPASRGSFHVTGELVGNNKTLDGDASPNENDAFIIDKQVFRASDVGTLHGKAGFDTLSYYVGVGLGKPTEPGARLRPYFDLGGLFEGSPKVSLNHFGGAATPITSPTLNNQINTALAAEQSLTEGDLKNFKVYPVVALGMEVHF